MKVPNDPPPPLVNGFPETPVKPLPPTKIERTFPATSENVPVILAPNPPVLAGETQSPP